MDVLGPPTADDIDTGFESREAQAYLRRLTALYSSSMPRMTLEERFPETTAEGLDVLRLCLSWNPRRRPTADEVLAMPYFAAAAEFADFSAGRSRSDSDCGSDASEYSSCPSTGGSDSTTSRSMSFRSPRTPTNARSPGISNPGFVSPPSQPLPLNTSFPEASPGALPADSELSVYKLRHLIASELAHFKPPCPLHIILPPTVKSLQRKSQTPPHRDHRSSDKTVVSPAKQLCSPPGALARRHRNPVARTER